MSTSSLPPVATPDTATGRADPATGSSCPPSACASCSGCASAATSSQRGKTTAVSPEPETNAASDTVSCGAGASCSPASCCTSASEPVELDPLWLRKVGRRLFAWRDLLPAPLALALLWLARGRIRHWCFGLPLILVGELFRLWGLAYIGPTTRSRSICADVLITDGPYRHVRNPLYVANIAKVCGFLTIGGHGPFALLALTLYIGAYRAIIAFEEHFLAERFPRQYSAYARKVPPVVPQFVPADVDVALEAPLPDFMRAVRSEKRTFASTGLLLLALAVVGAWRAWRKPSA